MSCVIDDRQIAFESGLITWSAFTVADAELWKQAVKHWCLQSLLLLMSLIDNKQPGMDDFFFVQISS